MTLVDSNVILDIVTDDERWAGWSQAQLERAAAAGSLVINDVIYAEISTRYGTIEAVDALLEELEIVVAKIPRSALFLAGKAYLRYRALGGARSGVLSDFFIGAHAAVEQLPLLTRDTRRYQTHFPTLQLITPSESDR
ncbi:MAG: type II toxin-antitoxin system VapC family toxin [bacterium]|nr:type II toxin-antitoxin system VapC family toxin [bacterium]